MPSRSRSDSDGRADRGQRRASKTRRRLLRAALREFSDKGMDATSVEEITERADVGKGTFYLHFGNKEGALVALVEQGLNHLVGRIQGATRPFPSLAQALDHLLTAHADFFTNETEEFLLLFEGRVLLQMRRETPEELEQPYLTYLEEIEQLLEPFLTRPLDPVKLRHRACALAGFVSGFFSFAMIGMAGTDIDASLEPLRQAFVSTAAAFLRA